MGGHADRGQRDSCDAAGLGMKRQRRQPLTRSQQMARIRGTNTQPELVIRRGLWRAGLRYRLHLKTVGGRADLCVPAARLAVFIDGCFWHGCPDHYVHPRSRSDFWDRKLRENVDRDRRQTLALEKAGWRVLRVWEHRIAEGPEKVLDEILATLTARRLPRRTDWRVARVVSLASDSDQERRYLEDLRRPKVQKVHEGRRSTKKVGRVTARRRLPSPSSRGMSGLIAAQWSAKPREP